MMRYVAACTAVLGLAGGTASAGGMLPNGAQITFDKFSIFENGGITEPSSPDSHRYYLNQAHCVCSQSKAGPETEIQYELKISPESGVHRPGEVWVGTSCADDMLRPMMCRQITSQTIADIDTLITPKTVRVQLYDAVNGAMNTMPCESRVGDALVWILVDQDTNNLIDYDVSQAVGKTETVTGIDTEPPPLPTNFTVSPGEASLEIAWDPPDGRADDIYYYQALCMDESGAPARSDFMSPVYQTTGDVCGLVSDAALTRASIVSDGLDVPSLPAPFAALDPTYICGEEASGTATSLRVYGLKNDESYTVALIAIDKYGNYTGAYFDKTVIPKPLTDLWEDLHDRNSRVQGGCTVNEPGSFPTLGFGLALAVACIVLRRRPRRALAVPATAFALVLAPRIASADDFTPYWEDPSAQSSLDEEDPVRWHFGIRLGPYTPDIDLQAGLNALTGKGPYASMFGDYYLDGTKHERHVWQVLPMLDVDRILWSGFGQFGVGGSIGYMQKTGYAYISGTSEDDTMRPRSKAGENTFRLIPMAATATFRLTWFDDQFGVPVVPYVRAGLSYYAWWIKSPSGDVAKVCNNRMEMPPCEYDKAYGASLGFQGSIGISIRAERLDADAAMSMRNSGIQHAGFYGEYQYAKVDGFGSDTRLWVGDNTWFAGVDFEF